MARRVTAWKWHFHEAGSSPAVTCILSSACLQASPGASPLSCPHPPPRRRHQSSPPIPPGSGTAPGTAPWGAGGVPSSSPLSALAAPEETWPQRAAAPLLRRAGGAARGARPLPGTASGAASRLTLLQPPSPGTGSRETAVQLLPPCTNPAGNLGRPSHPGLGAWPHTQPLGSAPPQGCWVLHTDLVGSSPLTPAHKISYKLSKINLF